MLSTFSSLASFVFAPVLSTSDARDPSPSPPPSPPPCPSPRRGSAARRRRYSSCRQFSLTRPCVSRAHARSSARGGAVECPSVPAVASSPQGHEEPTGECCSDGIAAGAGCGRPAPRQGQWRDEGEQEDETVLTDSLEAEVARCPHVSADAVVSIWETPLCARVQGDVVAEGSRSYSHSFLRPSCGAGTDRGEGAYPRRAGENGGDKAGGSDRLHYLESPGADGEASGDGGPARRTAGGRASPLSSPFVPGRPSPSSSASAFPPPLPSSPSFFLSAAARQASTALPAPPSVHVGMRDQRSHLEVFASEAFQLESEADRREEGDEERDGDGGRSALSTFITGVLWGRDAAGAGDADAGREGRRRRGAGTRGGAANILGAFPCLCLPLEDVISTVATAERAALLASLLCVSRRTQLVAVRRSRLRGIEVRSFVLENSYFFDALAGHLFSLPEGERPPLQLLRIVNYRNEDLHDTLSPLELDRVRKAEAQLMHQMQMEQAAREEETARTDEGTVASQGRREGAARIRAGWPGGSGAPGACGVESGTREREREGDSRSGERGQRREGVTEVRAATGVESSEASQARLVEVRRRHSRQKHRRDSSQRNFYTDGAERLMQGETRRMSIGVRSPLVPPSVPLSSAPSRCVSSPCTVSAAPGAASAGSLGCFAPEEAGPARGISDRFQASADCRPHTDGAPVSSCASTACGAEGAGVVTAAISEDGGSPESSNVKRSERNSHRPSTSPSPAISSPCYAQGSVDASNPGASSIGRGNAALPSFAYSRRRPSRLSSTASLSAAPSRASPASPCEAAFALGIPSFVSKSLAVVPRPVQRHVRSLLSHFPRLRTIELLFSPQKKFFSSPAHAVAFVAPFSVFVEAFGFELRPIEFHAVTRACLGCTDAECETRDETLLRPGFDDEEDCSPCGRSFCGDPDARGVFFSERYQKTQDLSSRQVADSAWNPVRELLPPGSNRPSSEAPEFVEICGGHRLQRSKILCVRCDEEDIGSVLAARLCSEYKAKQERYAKLLTAKPESALRKERRGGVDAAESVARQRRGVTEKRAAAHGDLVECIEDEERGCGNAYRFVNDQGERHESRGSEVRPQGGGSHKERAETTMQSQRRGSPVRTNSLGFPILGFVVRDVILSRVRDEEEE
ncbi:hypothetical protein BESB_016650 [Besnoitia besnoiti]|uniref:Uncharacterized protein n=1 Tax=Besnoitia besnoiti TaxID=94643 RepID=A0A2A9M9S5_BESBE|nr:hypothetical protein BESB_016650 [Besnoitia besnoiti]PFH32347.1 hypothetical protein BESB_016650 [Besnoitia besnoiti]